MPHAAILVAMLFWSSSFAAAKAVVAAVPASEALVLRFLVAAIVLALVALLLRQSLALLRYGRQAFVVGIFEPGAASLLAFWGLSLTSATHATIIFAWAPIVQSLLARWFLGEKLSLPVIAGAGVALAGTGLLVADDLAGNSSLLGDGLCLLALLFMSSTQIVLRRVAQAHGQPLAVTTAQMLGGAVAAAIAAVAIEMPILGVTWRPVESLEIALLLLYLAVFVSAGAFGLNNYALRFIPVGRLSLYYVLLAPLGVPIAALLLDEPITLLDGAGVLLVALGVALPALPRRLLRLPERHPAG